MQTDKMLSELQSIFRDVFDDDSIVLNLDMTADDIAGWDSLMHINIIIAAENRFAVKFSVAEISATKSKGQNVGTFLKMIQNKLNKH